MDVNLQHGKGAHDEGILGGRGVGDMQHVLQGLGHAILNGILSSQNIGSFERMERPNGSL